MLTAPPNVMPALFVIVKVVRLVELPDPTAAKLMVPASAFRVRVSADPPAVPSVVPERVIPPDPAVKVGDVASAMVKFPPREIREFVVEMLFARFTFPDVLNPVAAVIVPVAPFVNVPLFVTLIAPVDERLFVTLNVVPFKEADPTATVLLKVVAPVAAFV
jgi:hypothetical protein